MVRNCPVTVIVVGPKGWLGRFLLGDLVNDARWPASSQPSHSWQEPRCSQGQLPLPPVLPSLLVPTDGQPLEPRPPALKHHNPLFPASHPSCTGKLCFFGSPSLCIKRHNLSPRHI